MSKREKVSSESVVETPLEFAEKISQSLNLKPEEVDKIFSIDESKDGYFVATLLPNKFLEPKTQFRLMCNLVKDLGGESYLQGAKSWRIAGPLAKKGSSGIIPNLVKDDKSKPEILKVAVGSPLPGDIKAVGQSTAQTNPTTVFKISQSSELCISALSEDEDIQALRDSSKKIGSLYPVLLDSKGNVIDGLHRLKADPLWPKFTVKGVSSPWQVSWARLIANERRNVSPEEKAQLLREIYVYTKWTPKQMAEELGWNIRKVYRYLPEDLKDQTKAEAGALGGSKSADNLSAQSDSDRVSLNLKPQDMTVGKARELLDTVAGREVLIDAVKEAVAKGEIPVSLDKEESLFADKIETAEGEHESIEDSENESHEENPFGPNERIAGVGSSEPVHRHKLEGTQVADFHCPECNQDFFIDHISAEKHRFRLQTEQKQAKKV